MLSSLNLLQVLASGYTPNNLTETGDSRSDLSGRLEIYTAKILYIARIILSTIVLGFVC